MAVGAGEDGAAQGPQHALGRGRGVGCGGRVRVEGPERSFQSGTKFAINVYMFRFIMDIVVHG